MRSLNRTIYDEILTQIFPGEFHLENGLANLSPMEFIVKSDEDRLFNFEESIDDAIWLAERLGFVTFGFKKLNEEWEGECCLSVYKGDGEIGVSEYPTKGKTLAEAICSAILDAHWY